MAVRGRPILGLVLLFAMAIFVVPQRVYAAGANIGSAQPIRFGDEIVGTNENSYDWYKFDVPARGTVEVVMGADYLASGSLWEFELYDVEQSLYMQCAYRSGQLVKESSGKLGLSAGTYYLKVETVWNGRYNFKVQYDMTDSWEVEKNDNIGSANPITLGRRYSGWDTRIDYALHNGSDWFKFTIGKRTRVSIVFGKDYVYRLGHWYLSLFNEKQERIGQEYYYRTSDLGDAEVLTSILNPGTYYRHVDSPAFGSSYHFVVNSTNIPMFRLYNPNSGEHFYTSSANEKESLIEAGWKYEGVGWSAPISSNTPVYRLYNSHAGEHHYTTSKNEKNTLVRAGWTDEGIGWYSGGSKPLYRQYNPNAFANNHNYTTSTNERDTLLRIGWRDEGVAWYGVK